MEYVSLNNVLKNMYDSRVSFIRRKNMELEREYFTRNSKCIPMSEIMQGASYEDHFTSFKNMVKNGTDSEIGQIFMLLQEYFLFSAGHDMMFKKKLEADIFTPVPMEDFIYPKLDDAVKERYNDLSVMKENPNSKENIEGIDRLVWTYIEMQSLLYLLYCNDFQFPNGWEKLCPDTHEEILKILNDSGMTIGDFLHALIDYKCKTMNEIFSEISSPQLRKKYLEKTEALREEKHEETKGFANETLPITFFLDHTFLDFINMEHTPSSILEDTKPSGAKKIILPKC